MKNFFFNYPCQNDQLDEPDQGVPTINSSDQYFSSYGLRQIFKIVQNFTKNGQNLAKNGRNFEKNREICDFFYKSTHDVSKLSTPS